MRYDRLTIDTSVFVKYGLNLEGGILKQLTQFNDSTETLILTDIVVKEVLVKLEKEAVLSKKVLLDSLNRSINGLGFLPSRVEEVKSLLLENTDWNSIADKRLNKFLKNSGAKIIKASEHVKIDSVFNKYFGNEPPFKENTKKNKEFPDAFALMCLENWAKEKEQKLICVSLDKDWIEFSKQSEYLDVVGELSEAISLISPQIQLRRAAGVLVQDLAKGKYPAISSALRKRLFDQVKILPINGAIDHPDEYQADLLSLDISAQDISFLEQKENSDITVVLNHTGNVNYISTKIRVKGIAIGSFLYFVFDRGSDSWSPITERTYKKELVFESEILIELHGNLRHKPENLSLSSVEFMSHPSLVAFGIGAP